MPSLDFPRVQKNGLSFSLYQLPLRGDDPARAAMTCVRDPEGGAFHALCVEREGKLIGLNLAERGLDDAQWRRIREGLDLSRLEALNLRGNLLTEVEGLEQMTRLRHLDLSHNQLTGLKMPDAPQLAHVFLKENPALATPPPEVVAQGRHEIIRYFRDLREQGSSRLYEAKVLILGAGGSGKTTLRRKLIQGIGATMPTEEESTHGLEVQDWPFECPETTRFTAHLWDFGGQEIYHATHQFFLTTRSLYLVLADERREDTHFDYWLQAIELLAGDSPVILVQNEKGDRRSDLGFSELQGNFRQIKLQHSLNLKNDGAKLNDLSEDIKTWLRRLEHVGFEWPAAWAAIRTALQTMDKPHIPITHYLEICERHGQDEDSALRLSRLLHDLGAVLHFQDDDTLKHTVILDNNWATAGVYAVVDDRAIQEKKGPFTKAEAITVWSDPSKPGHQPSYKRMAGELLHLMLKFEICYQLEDASEPTYLVPQLLPKERPAATLGWDKTDNLQLRYDYTFLPKGMCNRLLVRLSRYMADYERDAWRSGAIFRHGRAALLLEESTLTRRLQLRASGRDAKELLTIVAAEIDRLNNSYEKGRRKGSAEFVGKKVPCNCTTCKPKEEPYFFQYQVLKNARDMGEPTLQCQHSFQHVPVLPLLEEIFAAQDRPWQKEQAVPVTEIRDLLNQGKLEEALELLPNDVDWAIQLRFRYNQLKQAHLAGILEPSEFLAKKAPLNHSLLEQLKGFS